MFCSRFTISWACSACSVGRPSFLYSHRSKRTRSSTSSFDGQHMTRMEQMGRWPATGPFAETVIHRRSPLEFGGPAWAPRRTWPSLYLFLVGLTMATGTVVWIEPAPIDIGLMLLLAFGVVLNKLEFRDAHVLPMLLLGLVAAA